MNQKTIKDLLIILLLAVGSTLLVWAPFILRIKSFWGLSYPATGLFTIWQNFDGLNYIAVAKTWYNPELLANNFSSLGLSPIYFAAHFPLYPALIWLFAVIFGFLNSMLFVTVLFSALSALMFYLLVKEFQLTAAPLWLTAVFLILPARWLIVRSVGAPEPLFIFLILAAFYFLKKEKYLLMGSFCALATLTKSPGVLLFLALALYLKLPLLKLFLKGKFGEGAKLIPWKAWPLLSTPLALIGIFILYQFTYKDFFAYFHSGDNIHLVWPPFSVFNSAQFWVGTFWLENIIYIYLFLIAAGIILWRKNLGEMAFFVLIYLAATIFVVHLDIGRYALPAFPFVIIAFEEWINTKSFKIVFLFLLIPVYLFAQNFLLGNTAPIVDFTNFK